MAGRILNRRELRKQADEADQLGQPEQAVPDASAPKAAPKKRAPRAKAPAAARVRKARPKKVPSRMRARWGVFDGAMKQVAIFDYSQRAAAEEKLADLMLKKKTSHFLQIVKEPIPEAVPVEVAL